MFAAQGGKGGIDGVEQCEGLQDTIHLLKLHHQLPIVLAEIIAEVRLACLDRVT
jgi:hypothetical protein